MKFQTGRMKLPRGSAVAGAVCLLALCGCGGEGFTGLPPAGDLLVATQGCAQDDPEQVEVQMPMDVSLLDVTLEVVRTEIDLVFGQGKYPQNYFAFGPSPGFQKLRVGLSGPQPLVPGTWQTELISLTGETGECDASASPDWRLWVSRATAVQGSLLLDESCDAADCQVPSCATPHNCPSRSFSLTLPEDAVFLEVSLESLEGDADLWVETGTGAEVLGSANPGAGYDVVQAGSELAVSLRGQTLTVRLESWGQVTPAYRLSAVYIPGSI